MNKVFLVGRLTKDPEMRHTTNNNPVTGFTLAVDRRFSKQGEEKQTDFIPIVAWKKAAEFCSKYFAKGRKVIVFGRIQTRFWDDNDGKRHYVTEVIADEIDFADSKKIENNNSSRSGSCNEPEPGFYPVDDDELPF